MFVEKLTHEDLIEIMKMMLKNESLLAQIYTLEKELHTTISNDNAILRKIYFAHGNTARDIYLINKEYVDKSSTQCKFAGKTEFEDFLECSFDIIHLERIPTLLNSRKIKKTYISSPILVNDFNLRWTHPADRAVVDKNRFYKFMYNKFGEEYKIELEKHFERESKEKFEKAKKEIEELQK
ncbi:MAG: hypothetical protein E7359_01375 [Clostridiales bacterium]|nr:hypothetical protein [Clostridiales bacterium]